MAKIIIKEIANVRLKDGELILDVDTASIYDQYFGLIHYGIKFEDITVELEMPDGLMIYGLPAKFISRPPV